MNFRSSSTYLPWIVTLISCSGPTVPLNKAAQSQVSADGNGQIVQPAPITPAVAATASGVLVATSGTEMSQASSLCDGLARADEIINTVEVKVLVESKPDFLLASYKDDGGGSEVNNYPEKIGKPEEFQIDLGSGIQFNLTEANGGRDFFASDHTIVRKEFAGRKASEIKQVKIKRMGVEFLKGSTQKSYGGFIGGGIFRVHTLTATGNGRMTGAVVSVNGKPLFSAQHDVDFYITKPYDSIVTLDNEGSFEDDRHGSNSIAKLQAQPSTFEFAETNPKITYCSP